LNVHIADATAERIKAQGLGTIGLLGTRFTMEEDFYRGRLVEQYGLHVLVPTVDDRAMVHRVIYQELVLGAIQAASKAEFCRIIDGLIREGAEGIILGCTEIGLLVNQTDCAVPPFDTTRIHAQAAVDYALTA
jgi:aspartate racemase